jgi:uncharacterized membrane protein (Fun14 family)
MKILAVVSGVFFAALIYLQSQTIINIDWDKLQSVSQSTVTTIASSLTDTGQVSAIVGNLGIPPAGFALGLVKG